MLGAESTSDLAAELRRRWARGIVGDGGPKKWLKKLPRILKFKPRYANGLDDELEEIWGVRHLIVHQAGFANREFIRRHARFNLQPEERLRIQIDDRPMLVNWTGAVHTFVTATDDAIVLRTGDKATP